MEQMGDELRDEELMVRVRQGSAEAFSTLYLRHRTRLLSFCFQMLRNWEDAGDILQDAFRYVHSHAETYQPSARFTTYLFHIARNMCIDVLRRRKRWNLQQLDASIEPADPATPPETALGLAEIEAGVKQAMEDLPEPYREVVLLRVASGMAYDEMATVVGSPIGTVKSRLHTGLELLRQLLRKRNLAE
jgi:RNA polymerase sigma-70 factor (ECF subfamily)